MNYPVCDSSVPGSKTKTKRQKANNSKKYEFFYVGARKQH